MTEKEILAKIEWLKARKGISASNAAACLGMSPYQTRLEAYNDLIACIDEDEAYLRAQVIKDADNPHIMRGNALEPHALSMYERRKGVVVSKARGGTHPNYSWLAATPDGHVGDKVLVEAKAPMSYTVKKLVQSGLTDPWLIQGWVQLACSPLADSVDYALLAADPWELHVATVKRDATAINAIVGQLEAFWKQHIVPRVPPSDEVVPELELPKVDGTFYHTSAEPWVSLANVLLEAQAQRKEWAEIEDEAKNHIKKLMGDDHGVVEVVGVLRAYYTPQEGRTLLDQEKCKALIHAQGLDITEFQKKAKASRPFRTYDLRGNHGNR